MKRPWLLSLLLAAMAFVSGNTLASAGNVLVSTQWAADNLKTSNVRFIEISVDPGLFERGHIPGAVNLAWHTDLVDTVNRDIISQAKFEQLLRKAGVSKNTTVVLYGDNNNWFAAWAAWVFDIYGVQNVKLLDGGRKKWEAEKREQSPLVTSYKVGDIQLKNTDWKLRARLTDVLAVVDGKQQAVLVDIRSPDEFAGKIFAPPGVPELAVRAGHIPGAVNVPWSKAVAEDGTFKSADELKKIYADAGIDGSKPVITYCRIGERSSHTWFALSKILGYDVRNYDGSWTEYGNSVGVPIANLAGTVWGGK